MSDRAEQAAKRSGVGCEEGTESLNHHKDQQKWKNERAKIKKYKVAKHFNVVNPAGCFEVPGGHAIKLCSSREFYAMSWPVGVRVTRFA